MKTILVLLLLYSSALGEEPKFIYDPRPDWGLPAEARAADLSTKGRKAPPNATISSILTNSVMSITMRYYGDLWKNPQEAQGYLRRLLSDQKNHVESSVFWDQGEGVPDIECTLGFKNGSRGKLLLWDWVGCFQDEDGNWCFVAFQDYFRANRPHPKEAH